MYRKDSREQARSGTSSLKPILIVIAKGCLSCRTQEQQAFTSWRSQIQPQACGHNRETAESDDDDVDDNVLLSYYSAMMTLTDTQIEGTGSDCALLNSDESSENSLMPNCKNGWFQAHRTRDQHHCPSSHDSKLWTPPESRPMHSRNASVSSSTFAANTPRTSCKCVRMG
jgi:hypothetical protein